MFRSSSAHRNYLREKVKVKFNVMSELGLSFQLTMIWCELRLTVRSRGVQCPLLKGGMKNAKAHSRYSFLPIEIFLSLCQLAMNFSSYHQLNVNWKERKVRYHSELELDLSFQVHQNIWTYLWTQDQFWSAIQLWNSVPNPKKFMLLFSETKKDKRHPQK